MVWGKLRKKSASKAAGQSFSLSFSIFFPKQGADLNQPVRPVKGLPRPSRDRPQPVVVIVAAAVAVARPRGSPFAHHVL